MSAPQDLYIAGDLTLGLVKITFEEVQSPGTSKLVVEGDLQIDGQLQVEVQFAGAVRPTGQPIALVRFSKSSTTPGILMPYLPPIERAAKNGVGRIGVTTFSCVRWLIQHLSQHFYKRFHRAASSKNHQTARFPRPS